MLATMPARRPRTPENHPLRLWREAHDLSQQEVAEACQLTQAMISYIEAGKKLPWRDALDNLRTYTGLPTDAFLRWREFMNEVGGEEKFRRKYGKRSKRRGTSASGEDQQRHSEEA
jgi:transcriptional regulator with XRE-family HTH domain